MAVTKAICFSEPAQPGGFSVRPPSSNFTLNLSPLWRYACLFASSQLALQAQEARQ
jgi:hypothetical protein